MSSDGGVAPLAAAGPRPFGRCSSLMHGRRFRRWQGALVLFAAAQHGPRRVQDARRCRLPPLPRQGERRSCHLESNTSSGCNCRHRGAQCGRLVRKQPRPPRATPKALWQRGGPAVHAQEKWAQRRQRRTSLLYGWWADRACSWAWWALDLSSSVGAPDWKYTAGDGSYEARRERNRLVRA